MKTAVGLLVAGSWLGACGGVVAPTLTLPSGKVVAKAQVTGHRGSGNKFPENTLPAYKRAFENGFSVESDLFMTTDGEVFASCETDLRKNFRVAAVATNVAWKGCLDQVNVGALWGAQYKGWRCLVPRLGEILALVPSDRRVTFDVKDPRVAIVSAFEKVFRAQTKVREEQLILRADEPVRPALAQAFPKAQVLARPSAATIVLTDDAAVAIRALEDGRKALFTNQPVELWEEMEKVLAAYRNAPIDRAALNATDYHAAAGRYEPVTPRVAGTFPAAGLHGRVAALDYVYVTNAVGDETAKTWRAKAWRNERVHGQFVVWTAEARRQLRFAKPVLTGPDGARLEGEVRFVRYVMAEVTSDRTNMRRKLPAFLSGDCLDTIPEVDMPACGFRPVWLTVRVPEGAKPGVYRGTLVLTAGVNDTVAFPLELTVTEETLPKKPAFFLDYWQRPSMVAAYHRVPLWSDEHYALMKPIYRELAAAGQKVAWTPLIDDVWRRDDDQVRVRGLVQRVQKADGTWSFDFSELDRYVAFCRECGIGPQIQGYSLLRFQSFSFQNSIRNHMLDHTGAHGETVCDFFPDYNSVEFERYWAPFLRALQKHVKAQGWTGDFYIAADEIAPDAIGRCIALIRKYAPSVKFALASDRDAEGYFHLDIANYSQSLRGKRISQSFLDWAKKRAEDGRVTTFYTCNIPAHPNNWVTSPMAEHELMGLYTAAAGLDGMLRWAAQSWPRDPLWDITSDSYEPGENFFIYPNARASLRWEILRDSIENFEKIRILKGSGRLTQELAAALAALEPATDLSQVTPEETRRRVDRIYAAMAAAEQMLPVALVPAPQQMTRAEGAYELPRAALTDDVGTETIDATLPKEGYALNVTPAGVTIRGGDKAGIFHARQTLRQLAVTRGGKRLIPCVAIADKPAFAWRGFMMDESRHFFGIDAVKHTLDRMAAYKLNVFHWHLTDNQGWRLPLDRYPEMTRQAAVRPISKEPRDLSDLATEGVYGPFAYTKEQVRDVLAHAAARHIRVIPEIEIPGHARCTFWAHPELLCFADDPSARPTNFIDNAYCVGNPATYRFLENVLDEVCELFPDPVVHIGGDEVRKGNWLKCPKCRAKMAEWGVTTAEALQAKVNGHFADYLAKKGKRAIWWGEIPEGKIPEGLMVMSWLGPECGVAAAKAGHEAVMCPHKSLYFDYTPCLMGDRRTYPWFTELLPIEKVYAYDPLEGIPSAHAKFILGGQCCNWTEYTCTEEDFNWKAWPRACAMAEVLWTAPKKRDTPEFLSRLDAHAMR